MKYIITENRIVKLIHQYLDTKTWKKIDLRIGGFILENLSTEVIRYDVKESLTKPGLYFDEIYINDDFIFEIAEMFGFKSYDRMIIEAIIDWFNQKYNKNLTFDNFNILFHDDEEYDDYEN